ncbi:MAG: DNA-binding transcriptional LysR family regulator [Janthinobacterium sp.]
MALSIETLFMFVQSAALGAFSGAARQPGKQQSTVSEAIANLEIDLGLTLFNGATRRPALTGHGKAMLMPAQQVLLPVTG